MILITGGAGKIGRPLTRKLADAGHAVRVLVRNPADPGPGVEVMLGDLTDPGTCARATAGTCGVIHVAATVSEGDPADAKLMARLRRVNVEASGALAKSAREAGATRFVHVSSCAVWGYLAGSGLCEDTPAVPHTAYGLSKLEGEAAVRAALAGSSVRLTIVRPSLVAAGVGSRHDVLAEMVKLARRGLFPLPASARGARKALIALADVVDGIQAAYDRGGADTLYVLTGPAFSNEALMEALARRLGRRASWPAPLWLMEAAAWVADRTLGALGLPAPISARRIAKLTRDQEFSGARAARELGFSPRVTALDDLLAPYFS